MPKRRRVKASTPKAFFELENPLNFRLLHPNGDAQSFTEFSAFAFEVGRVPEDYPPFLVLLVEVDAPGPHPRTNRSPRSAAPLPLHRSARLAHPRLHDERDDRRAAARIDHARAEIIRPTTVGVSGGDCEPIKNGSRIRSAGRDNVITVVRVVADSSDIAG